MHVRAQRALGRLSCGHHGYWWHHWFAVPCKDCCAAEAQVRMAQTKPRALLMGPSRCHGNTGCSLKLPACITWCSWCKQNHSPVVSTASGRAGMVLWGEWGILLWLDLFSHWFHCAQRDRVSLALTDKSKTHKSLAVLQQFCGWGTASLTWCNCFRLDLTKCRLKSSVKTIPVITEIPLLKVSPCLSLRLSF